VISPFDIDLSEIARGGLISDGQEDVRRREGHDHPSASQRQTAAALPNPLQRVKSSYDAVAAEYAQRIWGEPEGKPFDRALLHEIAAGATGLIRDLGCGPGHVAHYLHQRGAAVLGIDLSPAMIAEARCRYPTLRFETGDIRSLPHADNTFRTVVAMYSLIHLSDRELADALLEVHRTLVPGGRFALAKGWLCDLTVVGLTHRRSAISAWLRADWPAIGLPLSEVPLRSPPCRRPPPAMPVPAGACSCFGLCAAGCRAGTDPRGDWSARLPMICRLGSINARRGHDSREVAHREVASGRFDRVAGLREQPFEVVEPQPGVEAVGGQLVEPLIAGVGALPRELPLLRIAERVDLSHSRAGLREQNRGAFSGAGMQARSERLGQHPSSGRCKGTRQLGRRWLGIAAKYGESPLGSQHRRGLGRASGGIDPVPALGGNDRVKRTTGGIPRLEGGYLDVEAALAREVGHPRVRLDSQHPAAGGLKLPSSDAGAAPHIEDIATRTGGHDAFDHSVGITRPRTVVAFGI
jgi:Methyltransferase domain